MDDTLKNNFEINSLEEAIIVNRELNERIATLNVALEKAEHERNEYRKLYELVYLELERMRRHLFGKKSERVADEQLPLEFPEP